MKKAIKGIVISLALICGMGVILFSNEANAQNIYSEKPILSILGDSISSYYGYETGHTYYVPSEDKGVYLYYVMPQSNMWWSLYSNENGYKIGRVGAVSSSLVAANDNNYLSLNNPTRIGNLGKNGSPDIIAVYGGINDAHDVRVDTNTFYNRYNTLVNRLHSLFEDVKLILMAPYHFVNEERVGDNNLIDGFDNSIRIIANNNKDYYVDLRGVLNNNDYDWSLLHPNESGMRKISDAIQSAMGDSGITNIRASLDYDHYIIKINAYDSNYNNLNFKFKLTNNATNQEIYNTDWQKENCFVLTNIDPKATYTAYAEIDSDNNGEADATYTKELKNLVTKRTGSSIYNGVDYSAVYDFNYYVEHNYDLYQVFRNDPSGALSHFVNYGIDEGRQASANFNVYSYRNQYSDLRQAYGWNNLRAYYNHYRIAGKKEGRVGIGCNEITNALSSAGSNDYSAVYNYQYYIEHNPDILNAYNGDEVKTFYHFLFVGRGEGRRASSNFDVYSYRNQYSDLRAAYGWDNLYAYYDHYNFYGRKEGRVGTGCTTLINPVHTLCGTDYSNVYDYNYYKEHSPDVYRAYKGDDVKMLIHFVFFGRAEGRQGKANFNVTGYKNRYLDLRRVYCSNLYAYYDHYMRYGIYEGRDGSYTPNMTGEFCFLGFDMSSVYDFNYYQQHNPDIRATYGNDDIKTLCHFVAHGIWEGRKASPNFDIWTYISNNADLRAAYGWNMPAYVTHYMNAGRYEGRKAV